MSRVYKPQAEQFKEWSKVHKTRKYTLKEKDELDLVMRNRLLREMNRLHEMNIKEYMLTHKFDEVNNFYKTADVKEIERLRKLIWKPSGRSDFRRIEPELILCTDQIQIRQKDFFDQERFVDHKCEEPYTYHWQIMRTLISSNPNDGALGRQLRYLVIDKVTRKYLGLMMVGSALMNLSERNKVLFGVKEDGNWTEETSKLRQQCFSKIGRSIHMASGHCLVATQPFGRMFNGGKLISLLAMSKKVQDDWKRRYGDTLVTVDTTSLYGAKDKATQYSGLKPYWIHLGNSSGNTPLKPREETYRRLRRWYRLRFPFEYFQIMSEINTKLQPVVREAKNLLIKKCFSWFGINQTHTTKTGHQRGVYLSTLYENADLFLQGKIDEKDLIPAFDNSTETLIEFWRFGYKQDTLKDELHPEIKKEFDKLKKNYNSKQRSYERQLSAKSRIAQMVRQGYKYIPLIDDWYGDMRGKKWKEIEENYQHMIGKRHDNK